MDLGLAGKIVIVTGGDKGIGGGITRELAREGAIPVIVARDVAATAKMQAELAAAGSKSYAVIAELSVRENCERAVKETLAAAGRIDALVNNAGVNDGAGLEKGNPRLFVASLEKNLVPYYCMAHYALPSLKATRGSIVNIGSKVAVTGQGNTSGYAASKGGMVSYTRHVAVELAPTVRVNCVSPGFMRTPMSTGERVGLSADEQERRMVAFGGSSPMGRAGSADDIANAVAYFASDESAFVTGRELVVDGGHLVRSQGR